MYRTFSKAHVGSVTLELLPTNEQKADDLFVATDDAKPLLAAHPY